LKNRTNCISKEMKRNNNTKRFAKEVTNATMATKDGSNLSDAATFLQSLNDPEIVERVRASIPNAHVFKLPTTKKQSATTGWCGADWKEKVWQGTIKVVECGDLTAILLVDENNRVSSSSNGSSIFAVCPVKEGAVDRCVDSSRYFVLRIENANNGQHMFIGVAFNERNDAFDFNISLEDSRREKEQEKNPIKPYIDLGKDYSLKEGEKIKVSIPKNNSTGAREHQSTGGGGGKSFLKPCTRDTPRSKTNGNTNFLSTMMEGTATLLPSQRTTKRKSHEKPLSIFGLSDGKTTASAAITDDFASFEELFDSNNVFAST